MYPTKEQILERPVKFRKEILDTIRSWKVEYYTKGKWQTGNKNDAIRMLLKKLSDAYNKPVELSMGTGTEPSYSPIESLITLDSTRPSIISALHEFGHHLKGHSELQACRWSVWLFIKCFPKSYEKLEWREHMLIKKNGP